MVHFKGRVKVQNVRIGSIGTLVITWDTASTNWENVSTLWENWG